MLRAFNILCCVLASSFVLLGQNSVQLSDRLQEKLQNSLAGEQIEISILLSDRVDIRALDQQLYAQRATIVQRTTMVIPALKEKAAVTQAPLLDYLRASNSVSLESIRSFWVTNVVFCSATPVAIEQLSLRADVDIIDLNVELVLDEYTVSANPGIKKSIGGHEPGHDAIKAPTMWAMGYSGYGRKVMSLDTGVDPYHPALSNHFNGYYHSLLESWFVLDKPPEMPDDCNGHGTHTVGIMCGLDTANSDTIGVAWGARWIGSPNLCGGGVSTDRSIAGFQWAMDPDSNSSTIEDMPDVINNSWRDPNTVNECAGVYKTTFDAVEAVGIAIVFSAGNGGPTPLSITKPKNINTDLVNVFCVANVDGNQVGVPIANLSSRGPSTCGGTGSLNIKPEVAAPGTDVRSCYKGDYSQLSGTSMAAPHVCGAIALLKEPFPYLTGSEIKLALYNTCFDLGSPGEDNTYGMGIIDLPAAYNYLIGQGNTPVIPPVNDAAAINVLGVNSFVCDTTPQPSVVIENRGTNPLTSSTIRYSIDQGDTMTVTWIGSLAPMDTVHVPLPDLILPHGTYEFAAHLVLPNGVADERTFNDKIRRAMVIPEFTNVASKNICASESTTLTATAPTSGAVSWFDQPDSSIAIAQGLTYSTPALNTTTIYYSDIRDTMFIGKPDTAGGGNYQTSTTRYLIFDCFNPFTLVSVKVYCSVAGPKTVELRDSQGNILDLVTVSIPVGESRVTLNFEVVPGLDYRLGISGSANLFRNNNLVFFPYTIPGVLSIKTSDQGPKFYYYYYDWEIAYWGPCGRIAAPVYVNSAISANVVYTPAEYDLVTDQEVSFQDNTVGAVSWLWDFGDGVSSTEQNVTHSYANFPRTYNVELFVADSGSICKDSISFVYEVISSAEDVVFPNPSSGNFTLDLKLIQTDGLTVTLYDITGKILLDGWFYQASSTLLSVDLSSLADGSYIIVVELSDRKITERLVKVSD